MQQLTAARQPVIIAGRRGDELVAELRHHDAVALARAAGFSLSAEEAAVLRRLSTYVIWTGRYPMPTRPPSRAGAWCDAWTDLSFGDGDGAVVRRLIARVIAAVDSAAAGAQPAV